MPRQSTSRDRPSTSTAPYTIPQDLPGGHSPPLVDDDHEMELVGSVAEAQKKTFVCAVCRRLFSTSGHLARHARIHTGERNHKCPFPGCETRCSRQDNLQQHYRIHLSPGSRRASSGTTRAAISEQRRKSSSPSRSPSRPPGPSSASRSSRSIASKGPSYVSKPRRIQSKPAAGDPGALPGSPQEEVRIRLPSPTLLPRRRVRANPGELRIRMAVPPTRHPSPSPSPETSSASRSPRASPGTAPGTLAHHLSTAGGGRESPIDLTHPNVPSPPDTPPPLVEAPLSARIARSAEFSAYGRTLSPHRSAVPSGPFPSTSGSGSSASPASAPSPADARPDSREATRSPAVPFPPPMPVVHVASENGDAIHIQTLQHYTLSGNSSSLAGATDPDNGLRMPRPAARFGRTGVVAYEEQARQATIATALGYAPVAYGAFGAGGPGMVAADVSLDGMQHDDAPTSQEGADAHTATDGSPAAGYLAEGATYAHQENYLYQYEHAPDTSSQYPANPSSLEGRGSGEPVFAPQFLRSSTDAEQNVAHAVQHSPDQLPLETSGAYPAYEEPHAQVFQQYDQYGVLQQDRALATPSASNAHPQDSMTYSGDLYGDSQTAGGPPIPNYDSRPTSRHLPTAASRPVSPVPMAGYPHAAAVLPSGDRSAYNEFQYSHDHAARSADDPASVPFVSASNTPEEPAIDGFGYAHTSGDYFDHVPPPASSYQPLPQGHRQSPIVPTTTTAIPPGAVTAEVNMPSTYVGAVHNVHHADHNAARPRSHSYVQYADPDSDYVDFAASQVHPSIPAVAPGSRYASPPLPVVSHVQGGFVGMPVNEGYGHHERDSQPVFRLLFPEQPPASSPPPQMQDHYASRPESSEHGHPSFVHTTMLEPAVAISTMDHSYPPSAAATQLRQQAEATYSHQTYIHPLNPSPVASYHQAAHLIQQTRFNQAVEYDTSHSSQVLVGQVSHLPSAIHQTQHGLHGHGASGHTRDMWTSGDAGTVVG